MVYGTKEDFWKEKIKEGLDSFTSVMERQNKFCSNQERVHSLGFRESAIVHTIFGYSVRLMSGLSSNQVLFGGRGQGRLIPYEEALEWGKVWVDQSPDFRILIYSEKCKGCYLDKENPWLSV